MFKEKTRRKSSSKLRLEEYFQALLKVVDLHKVYEKYTFHDPNKINSKHKALGFY